jgi:multiple RNA-binding domain-containing protein 1
MEIHEIFSRYGEINRIEVSPFNTLAIVEYVSAMQAQAAAKNLAYYKVNYIMPIYLEFAPDIIASQIAASREKPAEAEEQKDEDEDAKNRSKTVFIKNLNFETKEADIEGIFKNANLKAKVQSVKIVRRSDNQQSKGYGFVEMETVESATRAIKKLQNFMIDDHCLKLSLA